MVDVNFRPPDFWNFKPFFTLQPVLITREKQLQLWRELIIDYHLSKNEYFMVPSRFPLFENKSIERKLPDDAILKVVSYLIDTGNAEWDDSEHTRLRIMWLKSDALASTIYSWATANSFLGNVYTIYELYAGEEHQDSGFYGTDAYIFRKALEILEKAGKCVLFKGTTTDEDGVKFINI